MNLLASTLYDPAVAVTKATTALLAMTAFDTTNLRLTGSQWRRLRREHRGHCRGNQDRPDGAALAGVALLALRRNA